MKKIIYPAVPSVFSTDKWESILNFIRKQGHAPLDHRQGMPFSDFELSIGREKTLRFMIEIMKKCDELWVFGCSDGVMGELNAMLELIGGNHNDRIRIFPEFDDDWDKKYCVLSEKHGDLIDCLRKKQRAIALVGPRAIGKTFWMERLISRSNGFLSQVKTNTTREPRNEEDRKSYNFLSVAEFEDGINRGVFLEHDIYHGNYYGFSVVELNKVLSRGQDGIFAITPAGSEKIFSLRNKFNVKVLCLKPLSEELIFENLKRRGIFEPADLKKYVNESVSFFPPFGVFYDSISLSGNVESDQALFDKAL